jgi:hypothetical protein
MIPTFHITTHHWSRALRSERLRGFQKRPSATATQESITILLFALIVRFSQIEVCGLQGVVALQEVVVRFLDLNDS